MPQPRPPTDDEPLEGTQEQLDRVERQLNQIVEFQNATIGSVFGTLPEYLPEPIGPRLRRAIDVLRIAGQSPTSIAELVEDEDHGSPPGCARDPVAFTDAINELRHAKWAFSLSKKQALEKLAGKSASIGDVVRAQRRAYSVDGNTAKKQNAEKRKKSWLDIGAPLRLKHPKASNSWLAQQIASKSGDKESTIRAAIPGLGLKKKKI